MNDTGLTTDQEKGDDRDVAMSDTPPISASPPRVERMFHDTMWRTANDWMEAERAIAEARDVCTMLLSDDEEQRDAARWVAEKWLGRFGR